MAYLAGWLFALGLISRVYVVGVEQMAISLTGVQSLEQVSADVLDTYVDVSYGPWRIPVAAAFGWYLGALLLAVAAYRARVFGIGRVLMFLWTGTLWAGVLKEASLADAMGAVALLIVLGPLGIQLIRGQPIERATGSGNEPLTAGLADSAGGGRADRPAGIAVAGPALRRLSSRIYTIHMRQGTRLPALRQNRKADTPHENGCWFGGGWRVVPSGLVAVTVVPWRWSRQPSS
jgi:hypothetical protein